MSEYKIERSAAHGRFEKVLDQCRDMVLIFSDSQISELFEQAGGALLDFAERAENNTIQGRFFEAMNLIQRMRPDIEHDFRQELSEGFDNFGSVTPPSRESDMVHSRDNSSELSLVEPDEMEESVASENLIIKANANFFPELYALSQRLSVINGGRKLKDFEIPAGPHHLVHAFRRAISGLEVEVRIKIILYALFDKFVINEAKSLYDEFNSSLKTAGILPNLKPVHMRSPDGNGRVGPGGGSQGGHQTEQNQEHRGGSGGSGGPGEPGELDQGGSQGNGQPASQSGPASLGSELFDSIITLMSRSQPGGRGSARRVGTRREPVDPALAEISSNQLVDALNEVQAEQSTSNVVSMATAPPGEIPNLEVDNAFLDKVKRTLTEEREHVLSQIDRDNLSPMDADLIDLIGMLFEYMLNDPVLPNLAKALLSHLHTPYLKVALIDRRLLVDARHPARRLLDQMVEAGSLWVDEANPQRGIFPAMQRVVDRALQEFSDDVTLFDELLGTFESAMEEQRRRTETMEQRTQETARGREKLQLAKRRATHQIQILLQVHPMPQPLVAFLSKTWLDQLVFILLRNKQAERSEDWRQAVKTSEQLCTLFKSKVGSAERQTRIKAIPELKKRISQGVQRMGSYSHSALDALFLLLDAPETWEKVPPKSASTRETEEFAATFRAQTEALPPLPDAPPVATVAISQQEQDVIERLRKMKFGTWFEFTPDNSGAARRIKLSWLSPLTSTCMFVDRSGMQAEIKTLHELAQEILTARAKVIPRPKHPFIERALVSIRKMLQGDKEEEEEGPIQKDT